MIDGGESGPGRRGGNPNWFRGIRDTCRTFGVPYFHKQGFASRPGRDRELDCAVWNQIPPDMVVGAER